MYSELESAIEAILFASGEPVKLKNIADAIEQDIKTTKSIIDNLKDKYCIEKRGLKIIQLDDSYQMCTNSDYFKYINKMFSAPSKKSLSVTLLETLAIIAYKQPITKAKIEEIRGVNADHAVNKLMEYSLITEKGRLDAPGKPILFGTTNEFLRYFGFNSISSLPVLEDISDFQIELMNDKK